MSPAALFVAVAYADSLAPAAKLLARDAREMVRADFDGSVLGTVELDDGTSIDVLVDVDPSPRGCISFDALNDSPAHRAWIAAHENELQDAWAARREKW